MKADEFDRYLAEVLDRDKEAKAKFAVEFLSLPRKTQGKVMREIKGLSRRLTPAYLKKITRRLKKEREKSQR